MTCALLTLLAPPTMEETLVDWLLSHSDIKGFTSQAANGHGRGHAMTVAEQVTGRRKQIVFWIELEQYHAEKIIVELQQDFPGSGLHYWLMPLMNSGSIP